MNGNEKLKSQPSTHSPRYKFNFIAICVDNSQKAKLSVYLR